MLKRETSGPYIYSLWPFLNRLAEFPANLVRQGMKFLGARPRVVGDTLYALDSGRGRIIRIDPKSGAKIDRMSERLTAVT